MEIVVFRNPKQFRLRRWVVQLVEDGKVWDVRLMFGGLFFKKRLAAEMKRMLKMRRLISEVYNELDN